jgi:hypothetical protein
VGTGEKNKGEEGLDGKGGVGRRRRGKEKGTRAIRRREEGKG